MRSTDFNYVNGLFARIIDKEKARGSVSITDEENTVILVWHASGIIENGGFMYFYEQRLDADAVALAYEKIGCDKCAEILRMSLSLFPASLQRTDGDERVEYIEHNRELFHNLSRLFWGADAEMVKRMADYVRANQDRICASATERQLPPTTTPIR
jgi:hypothetical protein